jgi:hypothetical protein
MEDTSATSVHCLLDSGTFQVVTGTWFSQGEASNPQSTISLPPRNPADPLPQGMVSVTVPTGMVRLDVVACT